MPALAAIIALGTIVLLAPAAANGPMRERTQTGMTDARGAVRVEPAHVGRQVCAECHIEENRAWLGSNHDRAMQQPSDATVLGNFKNGEFTTAGVTTHFNRRDGRFLVRTDGSDGSIGEYEVAYTFGIYPLQQYLLRVGAGKLQALMICWDARPAREGGQRWFHLSPHEAIPHTDILHWTGAYQNWNHMCAECHSTHVRKGYDEVQKAYATTFSEVDVSCEACHGPGSNHVAWARNDAANGSPARASEDGLGLLVRLKETPLARWVPDPATGIAKRSVPRQSRAVLDTCARCHARRGTFSEEVVPGRPLGDTHRLALLETELYYADGQIRDEVFEHGSFLQSKMHAAGVNCIDCHDPHSLKTPGGNTTCLKCHAPDVFDTPTHHHHAVDTPGASCVACHAPTTHYMVVHPRHDHSFRVPRPDLTLTLGTPNACTGCHADQSAHWAADAAAKWWGTTRANEPHFGQAIHAGRLGLAHWRERLVSLLRDEETPAIVRATAVDLLGSRLQPADPVAQVLLSRGTHDPDPDIRAATARAAQRIGYGQVSMLRFLFPLLNDPVRLVRMDAARALAAVPRSELSPDTRAAVERGLDEYRAAERIQLDRAEARLNLGSLALDLGDLAEAEREFRAATELNGRFAPGWVNLADLYRMRGQEREAESALREGIAQAGSDGALELSLGLALARQRRIDEAISHLRKAVEVDRTQARPSFVLAVALDSVGRRAEATEVARAGSARYPGDIEILSLLARFALEANDVDSAREYVSRLAELRPEDPRWSERLRSLGPSAPRQKAQP